MSFRYFKFTNWINQWLNWHFHIKVLEKVFQYNPSCKKYYHISSWLAILRFLQHLNSFFIFPFTFQKWFLNITNKCCFISSEIIKIYQVRWADLKIVFRILENSSSDEGWMIGIGIFSVVEVVVDNFCLIFIRFCLILSADRGKLSSLESFIFLLIPPSISGDSKHANDDQNLPSLCDHFTSL